MDMDEKIYSKSIELINLLIEKRQFIATAESCTGGMIASSIVDVPNASNCFNEGFVTYSNNAKQKYIGVSEKTLSQYGAVSENTVIEMAKGVIGATGADISVVSSGIAGPGGETKDKPVGLVYLAVSYKGNVKTSEKIYEGDRTAVRKQATYDAICMCIYMLTKM